MNKYLYIFKSELMTSLQYVFEIVAKFFSYALLIFIFVNLWKYIYADPEKIINGYSMSQMIWYIILTEIIWSSIGGRQLTREISDDVKSGNIAYKIIKPYNYVNYIISSHLGKILFKFVLLSIFGIVLGFILIGTFPPINILSAIVILISIFIALIINTLFSIIIGSFSFIVEDSGPLYWLYSKFVLIVGTLFPVEYFPGIFGKILKYTPIVAICYGPAKLFVDFSWSLALEIFIAQIIYLVVIYLITQLIYKKGVKKLNVNGG